MPFVSFEHARARASRSDDSKQNELVAGSSAEAATDVVVNCSLFVPIPSFTDMIINRYGMRPDIHNAHLSGTGRDATRGPLDRVLVSLFFNFFLNLFSH